MKALIIGGTGKVGRNVVNHLRELGVQADAAARSGGEVQLDMRDARAVTQAAKGYDAAFFITPLGPDETEVGLAVVAALSQAGVERIGYLGIHNLDTMRAIPHFETKVPIRDAVLAQNGVVIAPNYFFDNDAMMLPAIMQGGVYPMPVGSAGVWAVDTRDIGRSAARALASGEWDGQEVPVCGPERLTGPAMAATWSEALGRPVRYSGDAIEPFVGMLAQRVPGFGEWERRDFTLMFEVTQAQGCPASETDQAASRALIGQEPRHYADYVQELSQGARQ